MKKRRYKVTGGLAAAALCSGCIIMSALADPTTPAPYTEGPTSNVWLTAVELPTQARISVTVPASYGFAVVGSLETSDNGAVTSANGKVLLSNVRVEVITPSDSTSGTNAEYRITTTGTPQVPIRNYSTDVPESEQTNPNPGREGLPVEILPYVVEEPDTVIGMIAQQHHWKPIDSDPTGNLTMFKRYRMGLNNLWMETPGQVSDGTKLETAYFLSETLKIPAPPDVASNGWTAGGTANVPSVTNVDVDVQVGGVQNQYKQVEQSVKVGQVGWYIIPGELPSSTTP